MARKLSVPQDVRTAIGLMAEHADAIPVLEGVIEGLSPGERTPGRVVTLFARRTGIPHREANQIVTQLMSFHQLESTYSMSPSEVYDAVLDSLESDAPEDWKEQFLVKFREFRDVIVAAISPAHPLYVLQKSIRLKYEYENILHDSNVLVDIRPIFDVSGREVRQLTIGYLLEVEYSEGGDRKRFFAAMDIQDVVKLGAACERAQTKTIALKSALESLSKPLIVTGETDDE